MLICSQLLNVWLLLKGCLDDSDCSEYGMECSMDGDSKHTCIKKHCPFLHVKNAMVQTQQKKVKDTTVLYCNKGFIFWSPSSSSSVYGKTTLKNVTLLCSINDKGLTVWVEKKSSNIEFAGKCIEGIIKHLFTFHPS